MKLNFKQFNGRAKVNVFEERLIKLFEVAYGLVGAKEPHDEKYVHEREYDQEEHKHGHVKLTGRLFGPKRADHGMPDAQTTQIKNGHDGVLVK